MPERPSSDYNSTQLELYAVCRIGLASYRENIADFTGFKAKYDAAFGNDFEAEINAAAALPSFQARDEASETAAINLGKKGKESTDKWQDLKRYITSTTGWEDLQKPKLEAAGSTLYEKAANNNWEILKGLMETANNFITNNTAELSADGNMPATFPDQFDTLKQDYEALYDIFTDKTQDQEQETDEKIIENNKINAKLSDFFGDGQAIYRDDPSMADRFTFDQVLKIVRGSKGKTKRIKIAPASREFVDRVVKNSKITNTGQTTLFVDKDNVETQTPAAVQVASESSIPVPGNSKEITIFNNDTENEGEFTVRVTVD